MTEWKNDLVQHRINRAGETLEDAYILAQEQHNFNYYAPIQMSTKKAAQHLIKGGKVDEGLLNMVEMAFRAYDPCFGCATHSLPDRMPLEVRLHDRRGELLDVLKQFVD